ncbi:hypothetical protein K523DRAFT_409635, partial [Schizophyllum commune Tattone D]
SCAEVLQVLVVGPDLNGVLGALKEVSPLLKSANDRQQLLVVDLIVPFHGGQRLGVEGHRMPLTILARLLRQHRARGVVRAIRLDPVGSEDGGRRNALLQAVKGLLRFRRPLERGILAREIEQRSSQVRKSLDEPSIEIGEA